MEWSTRAGQPSQPAADEAGRSVDSLTVVTGSPVATFNLGRRMGARLAAGTTIALIGELGCGKTLLTRGICAGLGVPDRQVNSPTFVLINEYTGRLPVYHMDLYRLEDVGQGLDIGLLDYLGKAASGVLVVEWAEKILSVLPAGYLRVRFEVLSARKRQIELHAGCADYAELLEGLRSQ